MTIDYELSYAARTCLTVAKEKILARTTPGLLSAAYLPSRASASEIMGIHMVNRQFPAASTEALSQAQRAALIASVRATLPPAEKAPNFAEKPLTQLLVEIYAQIDGSLALNKEIKADYDRCIGTGPSFVPRAPRQRNAIGDF